MKKRMLVIDGNWYLHRLYHTQFETTDKGAAIAKRFVSMICRDALAIRATKLVVAFDGARVFRFKLFKDYKGTRNKSNKEVTTGEGPYDYLAGVIGALAECGIPCIQISKYEGDDISCSIAIQNCEEYDVYIGVRDKDAYQFTVKGVFLYDASTKPVQKPKTRP